MFKRLPEAQAEVTRNPVSVTVNGIEVACRHGDSVASVLLAAGILACRDTPVKGTPRGPFCMMGVCYDCLVNIDDLPNQQGCMVLVKPGMKIERQQALREVQS